MTNVESGLEKISFSKQNAKERRTIPVTRDGTRLATSHVSHIEEPSPPQPRTRFGNTAWPQAVCEGEERQGPPYR